MDAWIASTNSLVLVRLRIVWSSSRPITSTGIAQTKLLSRIANLQRRSESVVPGARVSDENDHGIEWSVPSQSMSKDICWNLDTSMFLSRTGTGKAYGVPGTVSRCQGTEPETRSTNRSFSFNDTQQCEISMTRLLFEHCKSKRFFYFRQL